MDLSSIFSNDAVIGVVFVGAFKTILGNWIKSTWQNFQIDRKWQFGDVNDDCPDYAEFCGADNSWGLVQFKSKCWWKNEIVLYHMTLVDQVYEYSKRTIDYTEFKGITRRCLSPEKKRLVKGVVDYMKSEKVERASI